MKRFVLDACSIYVGTIKDPSDLTSISNNLLGLTNGGVTITATPNVRQIEFDGKRERRIKDMNRILGWDCGAETKGLELNEKSLKLSLIKKDDTYSNETYEKYIPSNSISYEDLVIVGQLHGTKPLIVVLKNCFNESGFSLETADSSEGTYSMSAYANYEYDPVADAEGTTKIPMEIYLPKENTVESVSINSLPEAKTEVN